MSTMSDAEVLNLAYSKMEESDQERLRELQHKEERDAVEQQELAVLWEATG